MKLTEMTHNLASFIKSEPPVACLDALTLRHAHLQARTMARR